MQREDDPQEGEGRAEEAHPLTCLHAGSQEPPSPCAKGPTSWLSCWPSASSE